MEFKLNKIDTDVRQKINDATKEGKIHNKKGISISKDLKDEARKKTKFNKNKKITVKVIKAENIDIKAFKEESDNKALIGRFVDIRK